MLFARIQNVVEIVIIDYQLINLIELNCKPLFSC